MVPLVLRSLPFPFSRFYRSETGVHARNGLRRSGGTNKRKHRGGKGALRCLRISWNKSSSATPHQAQRRVFAHPPATIFFLPSLLDIPSISRCSFLRRNRQTRALRSIIPELATLLSVCSIPMSIFRFQESIPSRISYPKERVLRQIVDSRNDPDAAR